MFIKAIDRNVIVNTDRIDTVELLDTGEDLSPERVEELEQNNQYRRYKIICGFGFKAGVTLYETNSKTGCEMFLDYLLETLNKDPDPSAWIDEEEDNEDDGYQ